MQNLIPQKITLAQRVSIIFLSGAVLFGIAFFALFASAATSVSTCTELQAIQNGLTGDYILTGNIDCSAFVGFDQIGNESTRFSGTFDGNGYIISSLDITALDIGDTEVGLFGSVAATGSVMNVGLVNLSIDTGGIAGGIAGANHGFIEGVYVTGAIIGGTFVGGVVGQNYSTATVQNSYATASIEGSEAGGLVGINEGDVINSYAIGAVTGNSLGGLIGTLAGGAEVIDSFATGNVGPAGDGIDGGLVGTKTGTITRSYWNNHASNPTECYDGGNTGCIAISNNADYFENTANAPMRSWGFPSIWSSVVNANPKLQWEGVGMAGAGTGGSPYQITNCAQLQEMAHVLTGSYLIMNDIDCNVSPYNTGSGFYMVGTGSAVGNSFTGTLNGSGKTVYSLYIDRTKSDYVGLFGYGSGSTVMNVGLSGSTILGKNNVGGFIGYNQSGTVLNSFASGNISGTSTVGGLVGFSLRGRIANSYSESNATGTNTVGGVVGYLAQGTISRSYAVGSVYASSTTAGGLAGFNNTGRIEYSFATGNVSVGLSTEGGLIGNASTPVIVESYWNNHASNPSNCYSGGNNGCTAIYNNEPYFYNSANAPMRRWDFPSVWNSSGATFPLLKWQGGGMQGMGTSGDPYLVDSCWHMQEAVHVLTGSYLQTQNIDCNISPYNTGSGFYMIGTGSTAGNYFNGSYNGSGFTVNNLFINRKDNDYVALFGYIGTSGDVSDIHLNDATVTGSQRVATLIGQTAGSVSNASASGTVLGKSNVVGLVIGEISSTGLATNVSGEGFIEGEAAAVGGLIGQNFGVIDNSSATTTVSGSTVVGGLVGWNNTTGISSGSYATGNSFGQYYVGGLVGQNDGIVHHSYATGSASGAIQYAGGLIGTNANTVYASYATGNAETNEYAGGLVAENTGTMSGVYATGYALAYGASVGSIGGLAGISSGDALNCYSTGTASGNYNVGGLIGVNSGNVASCYSTASVTASANLGGGLVGSNTGAGDIVYSYARGNVDDLTNTYGFAGINDASISNSYWNNHSGNPATDGCTSGCTEITDNEAYFYEPTNLPMSSWNFSSIWIDRDVDDPALLWQFTNISTCQQLQNMNTSGSYVLNQNIDCSATSGWNGGQGFDPIGTSANPFAGDFLGQNFVISDLSINRPAEAGVGVISYASGSALTRVGLENVTMTGSEVAGFVYTLTNSALSGSYVTGSVEGAICGTISGWCGGLVADNTFSTITYSHSQAHVSGDGKNIGGVVGRMNGGLIEHSYASGSVIGNGTMGGLVGLLSIGTASGSYATGNISASGSTVGGLIGQSAGRIYNSYATGTVDGMGSLGGFIGVSSGTASGSYAIGDVTGTNSLGGFVGYMGAGSVEDSYATGDVTGSGLDVGGFVGFKLGTITNAYATGNVTGDDFVGGFAGENDTGGIENAFSVGSVTGNTNVGGFQGAAGVGSRTNIHWFDQPSDDATSCYGTGDTGCSEASSVSYFYDNANEPMASWDFVSTWVDYVCNYPLLAWQQTISETCTSIVGRLFADQGVTPLASKLISVSLNGGAKAGDGTTDAGGQYTIDSGVESMTGGTIVTLYVDDETENAVTVTLGSGSSMSGIDLYQNYLIIRTRTGSIALTNETLNTANNNGDSDINAIYTLDGSNNLTLPQSNLQIWDSTIYQPGAGVTVAGSIDIDGTFAPASNIVTLSGSWLNSGNFTKGTSNVIFNATTGSQSILGNNDFYNLTASGSQELVFDDSITQTISQVLSLQGTSAESPLKISSLVAGIPSYLNTIGTFINAANVFITDHWLMKGDTIEVDPEGSSSNAYSLQWVTNPNVSDGTLLSTVTLDQDSTNGPTLADGDQFGSSIANIGDLNGDGIQDLLVGARNDKEGGLDRGAVHILFMNRDGSIQNLVEINSSTTNGPTISNTALYGEGAAGLGDLDGDGVPDFAVGAHGDDTLSTNEGAVFIHFMNTNGTIKSTVKIDDSTTNGPVLTPGDFYGTSIANIGDLDGDGVIDIAVGAIQDDAGGSNRGTVHIHFLNSDGSIKSTTEINTTTPNGATTSNDSEFYGYNVNSLGDLNGDGIPDLAVGAPANDNGGTNRGALHIHFMDTDGSIKSTATLNSSTTNGATLSDSDFYGIGATTIGDLNADGVQDLLVGAYFHNSGDGAVYIHFMDTDGSVKSTTRIDGSTANGATTSTDLYGWSVAPLGDLDENGIVDIAVGERNGDTGGSSRGEINIHFLGEEASTYPITGTVYADQGVTPLAGVSVSVSVDGAANSGSGTTDAGGQFTISSVSGNADSVMTFYLNGETQKAVTVVLGSGSTMTGINLYQNRLILRSETSTAVTGSHVATADNNADTDISDVYTMTDTALSVSSDKELYIWSGDTFIPGDSVTADDIEINGTFSLANNSSSSGVTLSGNWDNNGSFTASGSIVRFNGTSQFISGDTTFYNFVKTVTSADTLTFDSASTITVSSGTTLYGAANNLLSLRSLSPTNQWTFNPQGSRTISYVDVQDSLNSNATAITCFTGCTDSGNNTNWIFTRVNEAWITSPDGVYGSGETISMNVSFTKIVNVTGTPTITLETGASDGTAYYSTGGGTDTLTFVYTVQLGHTSADLDYVSSGSLALNGGTIKDLGNSTVRLWLAEPAAVGSLSYDSAVVIGSCGDGAIDDGEQCDDGGFTSGDGCSASCQFESGWSCAGEPTSCTEICGDGIIVGDEACDDSGTSDDDGCSSTCTVETGYSCSSEPSSCSPVCGDGLIISPEVCDDGNTNNNDVCTAACQPNVCGDGFIYAGVEQCDDGNTSAGDGCNQNCLVETGGAGTGNQSSRSSAASSSSEGNQVYEVPIKGTSQSRPGVLQRIPIFMGVCGNGLIDKNAGEQCDDGIFNGQWLCTTTCRFKNVCGNGFLDQPTEECDDGNTIRGDGCSEACTREAQSSAASSVLLLDDILQPSLDQF